MTIPSTARKAGPLLGTGAQTAWPFTFKVFAASDIAVTIADSLGIETPLVLDTDYSVTLNANQETSPGGTVTYPISGSALAVGSKLSIIGDLDYDQPLDLPSGGNFSPLALENQLDRMTMQLQQLEERLSRALLVPVNSTADVQLPNPEPNELIGWDSTGDNLANYALSELATGIAYGTMRFDTFTGNGSTTQFALTEDPAALANLDVSLAGVTQVPGTDYTLTSATLVFTTAPANGVAILARYGRALPIVGPTDSSAVTHVAAGAGAVATTVQAKLRESVSVLDFGAVGDGVTDDTAAIQAAILASVGMANLAAQTTGGVFTVYVPAGTYKISTVYLPRFVNLVGSGMKNTTFTTTSNAPAFVLGRSLAETAYLDVRLTGFTVRGNLTGASQYGIQGTWSGVSAYGYPLIFRDIYVANMGADGIRITSNNAAGQLLYTNWSEVWCSNNKGYGLYINVPVFNDALFTTCHFEFNLLGGVFFDFFGSGTDPAEVIKFQNCSFESNGILIGGSYATGAFGFKSLMYSIQVYFDSCYFEGNGAGPDSTAYNIYCVAPWMLQIVNSLLVSTTNQIGLKQGGRAVIEGNFINSTGSFTSIITADTAPIGNDTSYVDLRINRFNSGSYTQAQLFRVLNSATTTLLGYQAPTTNYCAVPPRTKSLTLRDSSARTAGSGAIGYNAVKRLTNNAGGSTSIPNGALASICKPAITTLALITDTFFGETALYFLGNFPSVLISQAKTVFSATAGTALKLNVYYDAGSATFVVQNNTASTTSIAVRFIGCDVMANADDGFYATNFLEQNLS